MPKGLTMKLKTIEVEGKTYAEVADGKPLFVADDGKDVAFDAPGTVATISRLNGEAKSHREGKEAAEKALKAFEGIEDPSKAIEALNTVSNLDAKKLIDAGEVEKVKAEMAKVYDAQLALWKYPEAPNHHLAIPHAKKHLTPKG
jgi:hypothetical protein